MAPEGPDQKQPPGPTDRPRTPTPSEPSEPSQPSDGIDPNDIIGTMLAERYRVGKRLGQGGMASVYLAKDVRLDRTVVVKIPHAALLLDPGFRKRFAGEVSNLTRLEHPNVLQIHDVGENAGIPFAVVQYLKGGDLSDRVEAAGGTLTADQVLEWLPRIAETLDYIHEQGFLHRDVSPGNIIFDEHGNSFLSDFGIATVLSANDPDETLHEYSNLTKPGGFVGAAAYAPPESVERKLNAEYDQYSLGVVVYEALSGELPFPRGSSEAMLVAKNTQDPRLLSDVAPDIPSPVAATLMRAISRKPEDRFSSSAAFAEAFRAALDVPQQTAPAKPAETEVVPVAQLAERAGWRAPRNVGLVLFALLALAGIAWKTGWLPGSEVGGAKRAGVVAAAVSFDAGSTEAEQAEAYDLCVRHLTRAGCNRADYTDEIYRRVTVGPFSIDLTEVTNREFAAWVDRSGYRTTAEERGYSWNGFTRGTNLSWRTPTRGSSHMDSPNLPVVHVTRSDARAYCQALGKRLPTEEEWEYAARGKGHRTFPWGGDWRPDAANGGETESKGPSPVGSHGSAGSGDELQDMAGNVWEWTRTDSQRGGHREAPGHPADGAEAILKGGSWLEANPASLRGAARLRESKVYSSSDVGFRCVQDV